MFKDVILNLSSYFSPSMVTANLHVTLWPAFDHFHRFSNDGRLQGIRLNSAMMEAAEIDEDFCKRVELSTVPLWFDVKGMQLRIKEVVCGPACDHLEFILHRPVQTKTPCPIWFKAGEDCGKCIEIRNGTHFIFEGGPRFEVKVGESIHLRQPHTVGGSTLLSYELEKLEKIRKLGFDKFYLSYCYSQRHVDEMREVIGDNAELILKIENRDGLEWVANHWKRQAFTHLAAARGDLFVELNYPHEIVNACRLIVDKDPQAYVGSRMLLSCIHNTIPSCADFSDVSWLYEIGYRNFLLCDELCLKENLLARAVNVFDAWRQEYTKT